ncbi:hypothetical protein A9K55_003547 [Cordyceps militaris]|uniref:Uncharacterized protein n=1 Tax=Cordyceps militaris TaxID=73501 RepID=A0A2H4S5Z3_CORMI|nr:hypothetical protein A9K55_003547 [Cordyceps militaris]
MFSFSSGASDLGTRAAAIYDTIALSAEQRDLAKTSRKWLTLDSSKKSKYIFSNTSEQLYRSLLRVVVKKLENLQNRNPNFNEVIKITTYLNKNQPLSVNRGHTTVAIQLLDDETLQSIQGSRVIRPKSTSQAHHGKRQRVSAKANAPGALNFMMSLTRCIATVVAIYASLLILFPCPNWNSNGITMLNVLIF